MKSCSQLREQLVKEREIKDFSLTIIPSILRASSINIR